MKTNFTYLLLLLMLGAATTLSAQTNGKLALDYLQKEYAAFGLEASDIDDLRVTDNYASPSGPNRDRYGRERRYYCLRKPRCRRS